MKAGFIQYDVVHDREENFRRIEEALRALSCDLVVLPELCLCGYLFADAQALAAAAEPVPQGASTQRMLRLSETYRCAVVFGLAEKTPRGVCNTAVVVDRGNYVGKYRKMHLTDFEKRSFIRGEENRVFPVGGIRVGGQICFDLWFPEMAREQIRGGADILCVPSAFGGERTWLMAGTRAMENLTPLVLSNRVGRETLPGMDAVFLGKSSVIDAAGERSVVGSCGQSCFGCSEVEVPPLRANVMCSDFMKEVALHEQGRAVWWRNGAPVCR